MDYLKKYKSFFYSYYLASGVRMTAGIVLPALVFNHFNMLGAGIAASLGALCVSTTDNPGPIHHRRNGMLVCVLLLFITALFTGWAAPFRVLLGIVIFTFCFIYSMIGVYGSRAISIGVAALLIMVLQLARPAQGASVFLQSLYILGGGLWYTGLSLLLYSFRPYKLAQQALGESISATADYVRIRAAFYDPVVDYDKTYRQMLEQQVAVQQQQDLVRELLFKSRRIVKAATPTGQTLVMLFSSLVDLFENIMTAHQDYRELHKHPEEAGIVERFRMLILQSAEELDAISLAVKAGWPSKETDVLANALKETNTYFNEIRDKRRTPENVAYFIALRHILNSIEDVAARIRTLHLYTSYNEQVQQPAARDYDRFITRQNIDPVLLLENLSLRSNYFRHALRVSLATIIGYIISLFLHIGHSYWILLTIIVILKPAYSLTKQRNFERLMGTVAGALVGLVLLYFIKDDTALFVIMVFLMVGTFSLIRTHYMISVLFMTPYILLLFHLLYSSPAGNIILDRVIDTGIGSAIAFLANTLLLPVLEQSQIKKYMTEALEGNLQYFRNTTTAFLGKVVTLTDYKVSRKNAFVELANLSDAFTRMLNEPGNKQAVVQQVNQFVVTMHLLTAHIATLSANIRQYGTLFPTVNFKAATENIISELEAAKASLNSEQTAIASETGGAVRHLEETVQEMTRKRQTELEQGLTETDTRKKLFALKSIADQFSYIYRLAANSRKMTSRESIVGSR